MKKFFVILALSILLVPGFVYAQCSIEGDAAMYRGWDTVAPNGINYGTIYAGQEVLQTIAWANLSGWSGFCVAADTFCCHVWDTKGWTIVGDPPFGTVGELPSNTLNWQDVYITAPCEVTLGEVDTIVCATLYTNVAGVCDESCVDCVDPSIRVSTGVKYWQHDTLIVTVVVAPPALGVFQDTLTLVEQGQTQAYVPFSICNQDECDPGTVFNYTITTTGHIPTTIPGSSINVVGGDCSDVYAILNAGTSATCTYDTLTIIVWVGAAYDTCVQIVHVVEPEPVPLFTVPVVTILVLALILAAAVFMRRRAAARA